MHGFRKVLSVLLTAAFVPLSLACQKPAVSEIPAAPTPAPTLSISPAPSAVPTAHPAGVPTAAPTDTPAPTATPLPDPFVAEWFLKDFRLMLNADGSFTLNGAGKDASGSYTQADGRLTLTQGERSYAVSAGTDGATLTLLQPGQEPLVFTNACPDPYRCEPVSPAPTEDGEALAIRYAFSDGGVVTVELNRDYAESYCFTSSEQEPNHDSADWLPVSGQVFRTFKYDGTYNIFVRDADGNVSDPYPVTVASGYRYIIRSEGLQSLRTSLERAASEHDTSTEAISSAVYADAAFAGLCTREGVVTAAVSTVSHLAELGVSAPYQGHGSYQGENDWGLNPEWGSKLKKPTKDGNGTYLYTGMQCVGAIVWAYKQAGINLSNPQTSWVIGQCGEREKKGDNVIAYDRAQPGDLSQKDGHYLMIVDRLDTDGDGISDAYLTYEMEAPHLTLLILPMRTLRYRTFFDMSAVFENAGRNRRHARFWDDTFFIPETAYPAALQAAADGVGQKRALDRLLRGIGAVSDSEPSPLKGGTL